MEQFAKHLLPINEEKKLLQTMRNDMLHNISPTGHIVLKVPGYDNPRESTGRFYDEMYEYVCFVEICQNKQIDTMLVYNAYDYDSYKILQSRSGRNFPEHYLTREEFMICKKAIGGII